MVLCGGENTGAATLLRGTVRFPGSSLRGAAAGQRSEGMGSHPDSMAHRLGPGGLTALSDDRGRLVAQVRTTAKYAPSTDTGRERGLGTRRLWEGNAKRPADQKSAGARWSMRGWSADVVPDVQPTTGRRSGRVSRSTCRAGGVSLRGLGRCPSCTSLMSRSARPGLAAVTMLALVWTATPAAA